MALDHQVIHIEGEILAASGEKLLEKRGCFIRILRRQAVNLHPGSTNTAVYCNRCTFVSHPRFALPDPSSPCLHIRLLLPHPEPGKVPALGGRPPH